jgi:hypothetical protein
MADLRKGDKGGCMFQLVNNQLGHADIMTARRMSHSRLEFTVYKTPQGVILHHIFLIQHPEVEEKITQNPHIPLPQDFPYPDRMEDHKAYDSPCIDSKIFCNFSIRSQRILVVPVIPFQSGSSASAGSIAWM